MAMKEKLKNILVLFYTFFKIGLFTFGGGYAMVGIIQNNIVEKKKWIKQDEFFEILVIAESTPGPISVNVATYVGYKVAGIVGSIFSTFALVLPSLLIIYVISLFFDEFLALEIVSKAFKGIKVGVMVLLITTIIKLAKQMKRDAYFYIVMSIALIIMITFSIFIPDFTWISLILIGIGLALGIINTAIANHHQKEKIKWFF